MTDPRDPRNLHDLMKPIPMTPPEDTFIELPEPASAGFWTALAGLIGTIALILICVSPALVVWTWRTLL